MKLDKNYNPAEYETKIYQKWLDSGAFKSTIIQKNILVLYYHLQMPTQIFI